MNTNGIFTPIHDSNYLHKKKGEEIAWVDGEIVKKIPAWEKPIWFTLYNNLQ